MCLAAYDQFLGLQVIKRRVVSRPTRISTLLHWRTLHRLIHAMGDFPSSMPLSVDSSAEPRPAVSDGRVGL